MSIKSVTEQGVEANQAAPQDASRAIRIAEREMDEAFRLTDQTHPMMQELKRLCVARRANGLINHSGGSND